MLVALLLLAGRYSPTALASQSDDSIDLDDGTLLRLEGVWTPYELFWNQPQKQARWQGRFDAEVAAWLAAHPSAPLLTGDEDRYGRFYGDIVAADGTSLRAYLLRQGLVIAAKGDGLRTDEAVARSPGNERGIWLGAYRAICQQSAADSIGSFGVIAGRIENAAVIGRILYLNFGEEWREDFTVSRRITRGEEAPDTDALNGTWMEARGWVEWRGGPAIIITEWSQIEWLGADAFQKKGCD